MPVYVYRRLDGSSFELEQRVKRVMQPFTPRYRGTGFYATDHRKATPPAGEPAGGSRQTPPGRVSTSSPTKGTAPAG